MWKEGRRGGKGREEKVREGEKKKGGPLHHLPILFTAFSLF
jgi:hypothetical protein